MSGTRDMPAWLRDALSTGGHQATAAEKRQAWARFAGERDALAFPAGEARQGAVFASLRGPGETSPLARRVYGVGP